MCMISVLFYINQHLTSLIEGLDQRDNDHSFTHFKLASYSMTMGLIVHGQTLLSSTCNQFMSYVIYMYIHVIVMIKSSNS